MDMLGAYEHVLKHEEKSEQWLNPEENLKQITVDKPKAI